MTKYFIQHYIHDDATGIELCFTDFDELQDYIQSFFDGVGEHKEYSLNISMVEDET